MIKNHNIIIEKPIIIAVDGNSASGKGTLSIKLAEYFGFAFLDTGLMYRLLANQIIENGIAIDDLAAIMDALTKIDFNATPSINHLHTNEISCTASKIACFATVRESLNNYQKQFPIGKKGVVVDGRDIGTVIFPNADCKLFIIADLETRAQRRYAQLNKLDSSLQFVNVLADMKERDERDSCRATAPMRQAEDALVIDTTSLTAEQTLQKAIDLILSKINSQTNFS